MDKLILKAKNIYYQYESTYKAYRDGEIVKQQDFFQHIQVLDLFYDVLYQEKYLAELEKIDEFSGEEEKALIFEEKSYINKKILDLYSEIKKLMLVPKVYNEVILEIRIGTGGVESSLFAEELYYMYLNFCKRKKWNIEELDFSRNEAGGVRRIQTMIKSPEAYSFLQFESGVHRIQRVPQTESNGRTHTSTATVAVLPKEDAVIINIREEDLRIDTCRSSGAGGQHVNTTDSAIRITHIPTGVVVQCQDERSQHKNKDKAMKQLYDALYDRKQEEIKQKRDSQRSEQIGTGDRSEKNRTYNVQQNRVTDHRIGFSIFNIEGFLRGEEPFDVMMAELKKNLFDNNQEE